MVSAFDYFNWGAPLMLVGIMGLALRFYIDAEPQKFQPTPDKLSKNVLVSSLIILSISCLLFLLSFFSR